MERFSIFCPISRAHFLCWVLGVVLLTTWLISSWEKKTVATSCATDKMTTWVKYMSFCAFVQLLTTFIFFAAGDTSHVKWDNSQNSTQKIRTWVICARFAKNMADSSQLNLSLTNSTSNCWSSSGRVGSCYIPVN